MVKVEKNVRDNRVFQLKKSVGKCNDMRGLNRKDSIVIARLRIGHTRLTHKYLFEKKAQPKCKCKRDLTVDHLLTCPRNEKLRKSLKINTGDILKGEDYDQIMKIITYTKKLGLYYEI
jgi:glucosamine 6-phosphate synthetase-like amidotransferase/phosphosugar isomerase protein